MIAARDLARGDVVAELFRQRTVADVVVEARNVLDGADIRRGPGVYVTWVDGGRTLYRLDAEVEVKR